MIKALDDDIPGFVSIEEMAKYTSWTLNHPKTKSTEL
jgi:hypothetical protein